jgi:RNA polymerase sigma factor (TIGR02999 family)
LLILIFPLSINNAIVFCKSAQKISVIQLFDHLLMKNGLTCRLKKTILVGKFERKSMGNSPQNSQNITRMLKDWRDGKREALDRLLPYVYNELHRQASRYLRRERSDHTLQTTALIHEAYLKLIDQREVEWQNRAHFFAVAAQAMRRILVDYARERKRKKRGGDDVKLQLDEALNISTGERSIDLVALDEALTRLAAFDERQAKVVELRYFSGMTEEETAEVLGTSPATVRRDWNMAKAWLYYQLTKQ